MSRANIRQLVTLSTATKFTIPFIYDGSQVLEYINSIELHTMMNPALDENNIFRSILLSWDADTSQRFLQYCLIKANINNALAGADQGDDWEQQTSNDYFTADIIKQWLLETYPPNTNRRS